MKALNKFNHTILTICLFFLLQPLVHGQTSDFIRAMGAYQGGDLENAEALFRQELVQNPDNDAAWYYLACINSQFRNDLQTAEEYLKKAVDLDSANYWYRYNLALLYGATDRMELCVSLMEKLLEENPGKSQLCFDIIQSYLTLGDIPNAMAALDRIERRMGKNEMFALTRIDLMAKSPDVTRDSIFTFLADYYKECKTPRLASMLGDYCVSLYRDTTAMQYYDEAILLDEDYTPAYYGKATVNQMLRQYDSYFANISHFIKDRNLAPQAKAEYVSSLMGNPQFTHTFSAEMDSLMLDLHATHPGDTTINSLLSSYYYSTQRGHLSLELLRQNVTAYPESFNAVFEYLLLFYYMEDWQGLADEVTQRIDKFEGRNDLLQLRAIAYSNLKRNREAISDYLSILDRKPRDTTVLVVTHSSLGSLYYEEGDLKNAFKHYEKALRIKPDDNLILNNYAYFMALSGKSLKKAREMSRRTIESEPDNPTYLDTYAWILHLLGQDVEAKAIFKHAMLYGGKEHPDILEHYSTVLEALGETDLANIYRNQARAMQQ